MRGKNVYVLEYDENKFMMLLPDVDKPLLDGMGIGGDGSERYTLNDKQYAYLKLRYSPVDENDIIEHLINEHYKSRLF